MRSPYCGLANRRSTSLPTACGDGSVTNACTCSQVGGSPVRSNDRRRISVRRSDSGAGSWPFPCSFASTNRSMSLRTNEPFLTRGGVGRATGLYAQCKSYSAPSAIQRWSSAFWAASSCLPESGGGMRSSSSSVVMRATSSLSLGLPGTTAETPSRSAKAPSRVSRRRSALRCLASGPWQAKQLSLSSGWMSRAKSTPPNSFSANKPLGHARRTKAAEQALQICLAKDMRKSITEFIVKTCPKKLP